MKRSNRLILLIGVFLAVVAFVLIVILLGDDGSGRHAARPTPPPDLPTVIATQDIALGVTITESMVTTETMPQTARDARRLPGSVARSSARSFARA